MRLRDCRASAGSSAAAHTVFERLAIHTCRGPHAVVLASSPARSHASTLQVMDQTTENVALQLLYLSTRCLHTRHTVARCTCNQPSAHRHACMMHDACNDEADDVHVCMQA